MKYILALILSLFLVSCKDEVNRVIRYDNVEAVWFHEANRYSITVLDEYSKLVNLRPNYQDSGAQVIVDLKPGEKPYAIVTYGTRFDSSTESIFYMEIHISSIKEISGGDWNHGKFGSGSTEKVN